MDDAWMHKIDNAKNRMKECKTKDKYESWGLKRYLQPLDIYVRNPFKDELKKYTKYCMDQ